MGYGNSLGDLYPHLIKEINLEKSKVDPFQLGAHSSTEICTANFTENANAGVVEFVYLVNKVKRVKN